MDSHDEPDNHRGSSSTEEDGNVKEATRADADFIANLLNLHKEVVWKIIRGMTYSTLSELGMAVHEEFSL